MKKPHWVSRVRKAQVSLSFVWYGCFRAEFVECTESRKKDLVEKIYFVPKKAGLWIKYEPAKSDAPLVVIFNVRDYAEQN